MPSRLFVFNVGNEVAIPFASHKSYTPPRLIQQMRQDLAPLARLEADKQRGDAVLISHEIKELCSSPLDDIPHLTLDEVAQGEKQYQLALYGVEPTLERRLHQLLGDKLLPEEGEAPSPQQLYRFFDRSLGQDFLQRYYPHLSPQLVMNLSELQTFAREHSALVVKRPFSSSGRGIATLSNRQLSSPSYTDKLSYPLFVEPLYKATSNWGTEFRICEYGKVTYLGLSHFVTKQFKYLYNVVASQARLREQLSHEVSWQKVEQTLWQQTEFLSQEVAPYYHGNVGIDMMVYEGKLHPCNEINVRTTMGHYALLLGKQYLFSPCPYYTFRIRSINTELQRATIQQAIQHGACIAVSPLGSSTLFVATLDL